LVSSLAGLGRGIHRTQLPHEAGGLILKLAFHAASAHSLFRGLDLAYFGHPSTEHTSEKFFDHVTTQALTRIALETYLTYYHVFQQPANNASERELRYCAWKLASLRAEGRWHSAAGATLPKNWSAVIAALKQRLAANVLFLRLSRKIRSRIEDGRWRRPPWAVIAEQAGLPKTISRPLYNMLSESMHSGSYAAYTVMQAQPATQRSLVETDLLLMMAIMGKAIHSHLDILELSRDVRELVEYWATAWSSEPETAK
jgi:hypothetical protein